MPSSDYITVPYVTSVLAALRPQSVLDVGIGTGKFGFLVRDVCDWSRCNSEGPEVLERNRWQTRLDGIEVCADYITSVQKILYDRILIGPAQDVAAGLGEYDMIHMGDVIEHLTREEGERLLEVVFERARLGVLVVTPVGEYEQDGTPWNPNEEHKSVWRPRDFSAYPHLWSRRVCRRKWVFLVARKPVWIRDPTEERMCEARVQRATAFRTRVKTLVATVAGRRVLNVLLRLKQRHEGWTGNVK